MKTLSYIALLSFLLLAACVTTPRKMGTEERSFLTVPPELAGADWKRTPTAVLDSPVKNEPLIWLGMVRDVHVGQKGGRAEVEWLCEHLSFAQPGPAAISVRPIRAHKGEGYFVVSLIIDDVTAEQGVKFKAMHTASPHYILVGGKYSDVVEREGKQLPFLYALRLSLGPNLSVMEEEM